MLIFKDIYDKINKKYKLFDKFLFIAHAHYMDVKAPQI